VTRTSRRRVAVTGLGVVSSIGTGPAEFAAGLRAGRSGARPITVFDTTGLPLNLGCEISGFEPRKWLDRLSADDLPRVAQLAVAAARMAVDDAAYDRAELAARRTLIGVGTSTAGTDSVERIAERLARDPDAGVDEFEARWTPAVGMSVAVARELGLSNVELATYATACAAGNYTIGDGFDAVAVGDVDVALCGGADGMSRMSYIGFYRLGAIDPVHCRPFDRERRGILTGEGAGMLVLEPLDDAVARGARIYAEVLGYGLNCDAHHPVAPHRDGVTACLRTALADAGVAPGDVDLISAHGTGTLANDSTECAAISAVFGDTPPRTVSIKSMLGHTMGAASALSAIASCLAITEGFIPPTINHVETDPDCPIDCVPNHSVAADLEIVQSNAFAFGGGNAVVLFGKN